MSVLASTGHAANVNGEKVAVLSDRRHDRADIVYKHSTIYMSAATVFHADWLGKNYSGGDSIPIVDAC